MLKPKLLRINVLIEFTSKKQVVALKEIQNLIHLSVKVKIQNGGNKTTRIGHTRLWILSWLSIYNLSKAFNYSSLSGIFPLFYGVL